jgi:hypothetical protein
MISGGCGTMMADCRGIRHLLEDGRDIVAAAFILVYLFVVSKLKPAVPCISIVNTLPPMYICNDSFFNDQPQDHTDDVFKEKNILTNLDLTHIIKSIE